MYKITITELEEIKKALLIANRELLKNKKHLKKNAGSPRNFMH